jgi:transposase
MLRLLLNRSIPMAERAATDRCRTAFEADTTLVVVIEMSCSGWLVFGLLPGVDRRPLKKMKPDENELAALLVL